MRKMTTMLAIGATALFFTACGGGGSSDTGGNTPAPPTTVNLIGTWDYSIATQGSICDGLVAQGVEIIESNNGDNSQIGDITLQGTNFAIDSAGNCYLDSVSKVDSTAVGHKSNMTKSEFEQFGKDRLAGIGTIESFEVINYNTSIISTKVNLVNNISMTTDLQRQ